MAQISIPTTDINPQDFLLDVINSDKKGEGKNNISAKEFNKFIDKGGLTKDQQIQLKELMGNPGENGWSIPEFKAKFEDITNIIKDDPKTHDNKNKAGKMTVVDIFLAITADKDK